LLETWKEGGAQKNPEGGQCLKESARGMGLQGGGHVAEEGKKRSFLKLQFVIVTWDELEQAGDRDPENMRKVNDANWNKRKKRAYWKGRSSGGGGGGGWGVGWGGVGGWWGLGVGGGLGGGGWLGGGWGVCVGCGWGELGVGGGGGVVWGIGYNSRQFTKVLAWG